MTQFPFYDIHTLTTGKGWLVLKSPWVSHIGLEASTWSVANLSALPTCIVQYMIVSGWICFMFRTSSTTTWNTQRKEVSIMEFYSCWYHFLNCINSGLKWLVNVFTSSWKVSTTSDLDNVPWISSSPASPFTVLCERLQCAWERKYLKS